MEIGLQPRRPPIDAPDTSIGRPTALEVYSLEQIVTYTCRPAERASANAGFVGTGPAVLENGLIGLMDAAERYAAPFLRGDRAHFRLLAKRVSDAALIFTERILVDDVRKAATNAWKDRDYPLLVSLLERLSDHRTAVEEARLAYARKR